MSCNTSKNAGTKLWFTAAILVRDQAGNEPLISDEKREIYYATHLPLSPFPWSAHAPTFSTFRWSPSPFPRGAHSLSTSATAGKLFLFGGYSLRSKSPTNDLYVISTRDFSTTLLKTSGDLPSPRFGHRAVLTSTTLLIWGGETGSSRKDAQDWCNDDSFYLLNLGTSDLF